jgi:hypothetical protein
MGGCWRLRNGEKKMPNYMEKVTLQEGRRKRDAQLQHTRIKTSINLIKQRKEKLPVVAFI